MGYFKNVMIDYNRVWHTGGPFSTWYDKGWHKKVGAPKRAAVAVIKALDFALVPFHPTGTYLNHLRLHILKDEEFNRFSTHTRAQLTSILKNKFNLPSLFIKMLSLKNLRELCEVKFIVNHKTGYMETHEKEVAHLLELIYPFLKNDILKNMKGLIKTLKKDGIIKDVEKEFPLHLKTIFLLHDIGKVAIGRKDLLRIFASKNKLTDEEFKTLIEPHSASSSALFTAYPLLKYYSEVPLQHHERWDGHGYPQQLKGKKISFLARLLTILDSFQAMTAKDRPYKKPKTIKEALQELRKDAGQQFDPILAPRIANALERLPT